jgi:hypothetical protein
MHFQKPPAKHDNSYLLILNFDPRIFSTSLPIKLRLPKALSSYNNNKAFSPKEVGVSYRWKPQEPKRKDKQNKKEGGKDSS